MIYFIVVLIILTLIVSVVVHYSWWCPELVRQAVLASNHPKSCPANPQYQLNFFNGVSGEFLNGSESVTEIGGAAGKTIWEAFQEGFAGLTMSYNKTTKTITVIPDTADSGLFVWLRNVKPIITNVSDPTGTGSHPEPDVAILNTGPPIPLSFQLPDEFCDLNRDFQVYISVFTS